MMERTFRLKTVVGETTIRDMLMASNVEDAILQFMETHRDQLLHVKGAGSDSVRRHEICYVAKVVVDDGETYLGRYFYAGIGRKGGVQRLDPLLCDSLTALASKLDVEPSNLESSGWVGEESYNEARLGRGQTTRSDQVVYQGDYPEDSSEEEEEGDALEDDERDREDIRRELRANKARQIKQEMEDMWQDGLAVLESAPEVRSLAAAEEASRKAKLSRAEQRAMEMFEILSRVHEIDLHDGDVKSAREILSFIRGET